MLQRRVDQRLPSASVLPQIPILRAVSPNDGQPSERRPVVALPIAQEPRRTRYRSIVDIRLSRHNLALALRPVSRPLQLEVRHGPLLPQRLR